MSVNTQMAPANNNSASRSRCLWLKFKAKTLLVFGLRAKAHDVFQEILEINPRYFGAQQPGFRRVEQPPLDTGAELF
jgi:hypothetical protein